MSILKDFSTAALQAELLERKQNDIALYIENTYPPAFVNSYTIPVGATLEINAFDDEGDQILNLDEETGPLTLLLIRHL